MASEYQIKFFKGAYGLSNETTGAIARSTATPGGIFFDTTSRTICVGGLSYGGNIQDVTFSNGMLTITKASGDNVTLDFTDTASASATLQVFDHMNDLIGVTIATVSDAQTTVLDYSNTNYISTATTLVDADKKLDVAIKAVDNKIVGMNGSASPIVDSTERDVIKLTINTVSQTDGEIGDGDNISTVTFAKVAKTGYAGDVAIADTGDKFTATNVEDALVELKNAITTGDLSIDGERGAFTTDTNSFVTISSQNKKLEVKLNENGYITKDANGLNLKHVDTTGDSTVGTDIATVDTVKTYIGTEIADLDVTEYAQAEVGTDAFSVYGIKEVDGKIEKGASKVTLAIADGYNATNNPVVTKDSITNAIAALDTASDVQPVAYTEADSNNGAKLVFKGVSETDGVIAAGSGSTELQFAKVATTGSASDVSVTYLIGTENAGNLQLAVNNIDSRLDSLEALPKYDTVVCSTASNTPTGVTFDDVTGNLSASNETMHKVYLVPSGDNTYGEYITIRTGENSYAWEKIGDTSTDLVGYVKTIEVNGKDYAVGAGTTEVNLGNVITSITDDDAAITNDTGFTTDYVDSEVIATTTLSTTNGTNATVITSNSKVKVQAVGSADASNKGLAEASDVKTYVGTQISNLALGTVTTGTNVSVAYSETNGIVNIEVTEKYADVTVSTNAEPSLTVTGGTKLAVGSDIEKVKEYTDYKISTVIKSLDADVTSATTAIATVQVVEQNGKITAVNVTTQEARVQYTEAQKNQPARLEAASDTGAVIGSDIAAIKAYIDAKATEASTVTNAQATIPVGTTAETILGTVAGTAITAKASFTWEEYA